MFKPLKDRVVIKRDAVVTEISGLYVPEAAQKKELFGTVVATGPDVVKELKAGQRVIFGKSDGVDLDSKFFTELGDYILVRDEQVRGIVNG